MLTITPKVHIIEDLNKTRVFYRGYCDEYTDSPRVIRYTAPKLRKWRKDAMKDAQQLKELVMKSV
jgi:hypothetical protein